VTHQPLLHTMDTLAEHADRMDEALAGRLRPLIVQALAIVFYDLTTIRSEGGREQPWQRCRLIVAHRPDQAAEPGRLRDERLAALAADAARWTGKLDAQDAGQTARGKKLRDSGATARFYRAVADAHLAHILKVDLSSERFTYAIDERALQRAPARRQTDSGFECADAPPAEIVTRYKVLADIERGFRVLKSEIEIAPVFHRLPDRIRAHALICFLALRLYRVLRLRLCLKAKGSATSPERALEIARRIQYHQVRRHPHPSASGLSVVTPQQKDLFETIDLPEPSARRL